jgi:CRISPR-associated protein Csd1
MTDKIGQHFRDLSIVRRYDTDPEFPNMRQILLETFINHKSKMKPNWDNLKPLLAGNVMRSILTDAPYPQTLLTGILGRIRADQEINYLRAAIIKACLLRKYRIQNVPEEVTMSLNKESTNTAYRLGRLFAVLEKAQQDAAAPSKLNTTIKDRFYGSVSATPSIVFPLLLRLAQHHIQKAEHGRRLDKLIEEIMCDIVKFPAHLSLDDQGMFAIGYYHQRQDFYTKSGNQKEDN